jgi:hypothetical protein
VPAVRKFVVIRTAFNLFLYTNFELQLRCLLEINQPQNFLIKIPRVGYFLLKLVAGVGFEPTTFS